MLAMGMEPAPAQQLQRRTLAAGLGGVAATNGIAIADYDRDGDMDIYFVVHASYRANDFRTWNRLFANRGDGTFADVTSSSGLAGRDVNDAFSSFGYKMGAAWGDYDNDGWPDLYLTHLGPNQLFRNNGNGTFTNVTLLAGVAGGPNQLSSSALWFDADLDGDLDLYVSTYADYTPGAPNRRNWLYENLGNGRFRNIAQAGGVDDDGATWMSIAIDANNDGHLDLYLANDFGANRLYLNNGDGTFTERTSDYGLEDKFHGMGMAIADCDGNGYFDIYLTNITEMGFEQEINPLFLNTGENYFANKSVEAGVALAGWGWGTEFFDLENRGHDDLLVVTGYPSRTFANVFFRNMSSDGAVRFENIAAAVGLDDTTEARGVAILDYDDDGDLDILVSNFSQPPALYQNTLARGNWLKVKLEGTLSNRDALGAIVEVWVAGQSIRKYHHGAQFLAQNLQPLHFGLGQAERVERIEVTWPGGNVEGFGALPVNQTIAIKELDGLITGVGRPQPVQASVPATLQLLGNYPNPFNGSARIGLMLTLPGHVELTIYDVLGRIVRRLSSAAHAAGELALTWDGLDHWGMPVSSGLYFYRVRLGGQPAAMIDGKMLHVK